MADDTLKLATIAGGGMLVGHLLAERKRRREALAQVDDTVGRLAAAHAQARPSARPARPARRPRRHEAAPAAPAPAPAVPAASAPVPPSAPARPARALSRAFDAVFAAHGQGLPVPYLRALAYRESGLEPAAHTGRARGLLQVVPVVLRDFNARADTHFTERDLTDPVINVTIAATTLRAIIDGYQRHHADVPNLREDWSNPAFAELLTLGWVAGFSERAGVGKVVRYLNSLQVYETITANRVHKMAKHADASPHLADPRKLAWAKSVVRLFLVERERDAAELPAPRSAP